MDDDEITPDRYEKLFVLGEGTFGLLVVSPFRLCLNSHFVNNRLPSELNLRTKAMIREPS
jgi:hypothetical protein